MEAALAALTVITYSPENYSASYMLVLAVLFNTLLVAAGSVTRAVNAWRITHRPVAGSAHERERIDAVRGVVGEPTYSHLSYTARHGIHTLFDGVPKRRVQTPLPGAAQYADQFFAKTYELMRLGRAWVVTGVAAASKPIVSSPIGQTAMALADGTKTNVMRFFHHLSNFAAGLNPNGILC